ncbi:hypothetical protein Ancab_035108 [Ancistrocladus abbreviatus]
MAMAAPHEIHPNSVYDHHHNNNSILMEEEEAADADFGNGYGCFHQLFCCLSRRQGSGSREDDHRHLIQGRSDDGDQEYYRSGKEGWMVEKLKKVKEVSEMVAGPKWKTWLRKLGAYLNSYKRRMGWGRERRGNNFQYDSYDYALNFDEGEGEDDQEMFRFSARFAAPFRDQIQAQRPVAVAS